MKTRVVSVPTMLIWIAVLLPQSLLAEAVDCAYDRTAVDADNNNAVANYAASVQDFNKTFEQELPTIRSHAASLYSSWKQIGMLAPDTFADAIKQLNPDNSGPVPVNDLSRVVEETLDHRFPRRDLHVIPLIKEPVAADGTKGPKSFNYDQYGEPQFEICVNDGYNPNIRLSVLCGTVTRFSVPDQAKFVADYVDQVKSSQFINAGLQYPPQPESYNSECPAQPATPAATSPRVAGDARNAKVATEQAASASQAQAVRGSPGTAPQQQQDQGPVSKDGGAAHGQQAAVE